MSRALLLLPGVLLAALIGALATGLHALQGRVFAHPPLESLVLALLLGVVVRRLFGPIPRCLPGQSYCAKQLLEVAVLLLGATMDLRQIVSGGPRLLFAVAAAVLVSLVGGVLLSRRVFALDHKPAVLIVVGNAICGNSAIATVAPLVAASTAEVAGAVAFTALVGVGLVLLLPFSISLLGLSHGQYGVLVGLSVYAVPQVLAASFPVSEAAGQTATLVKLIRVLFLAPVAVYFALRESLRATSDAKKDSHGKRLRLPIAQLLPWFIVGFLLLSSLRSLGLISPGAAAVIKEVSRCLTILGMAALGLAVDVHALRVAGRRTAGAVLSSLLLLLAVSFGLIRWLHLGQ
jgi:uncharacterized integral membrane protein (TIGR00698 family)